MDLNFSLHSGQLEVFQDEHRFKIIVAGRRWGKTRLAAVTCLIEALKTKNEFGYDLKGKDVYYIAPTFEQAKRNIWALLKDLGKDIITSVYENTGSLTIVGGCKIEVKGSDRPDTLRGVGLRTVILDEYADMKPEVWEQIIRPTLTDVKGSATFIGTPKGKNHFFELYDSVKDDPDWKSWTFRTVDNPTLPSEEVEAARKNLSSEAFRQEYEATFSASGSGVLKEEWITYGPEPSDGYYFVAVDPAGFQEVKGEVKSKLKKLDETAIAVVKVTENGWWIKEILTGRWGIKETALKIVQTCDMVRSMNCGIERGSLNNAIMPYIEDTKRRLNSYPVITAVTHGSKKKTERIAWSLQGRFEHGKIVLNRGEWNKKFIDQYLDFPNAMAHDDMLDALSYIDQVAVVPIGTFEMEEFQPLDIIAGY